MRVVKKNVYYCDHCKKKGLSAIHIRNHEMRCTNNPKRWCGCCESASVWSIAEHLKGRFTLADNPIANPSFDDLYDPEANHDEKIVTWIGEPVTLQEVRALTDNCPACILAVLRQTGLNRHYFHFEPFDFKKELKSHMADNNQERNPYF